MQTFTVTYLACAAALTGVMVFKFSALRRRWGTPRLWSLCALFLFASLTFAFAAPATISAVNRVTGVANISALIVYSLVVAIAATNIVLGLYWRYPAAEAWRTVRWIFAVYATAITAMALLFAVSDVPVERRTDFDTYYADQHTVLAFLLVYLFTTFLGMASLAYLCLRWSNSEPVSRLPWLRRTMRIFAAAAICPALFAVVKILTVIPAAFGNHALDELSTTAPLLNIFGVVIVVLGVPLPAWGPALSNWRSFRALRPLHRALAAANPDTVRIRTGKRFDPHHRVHRLRIELSDLRWALAPRIDHTIRDTAQLHASRLRIDGKQFDAVTEAAQLRSALELVGLPHTAHAGAAQLVPTDTSDEEPQDGRTTDLDWWLMVARVWRSRSVDELLRRHRGTAGDPSR